MAVQMGGKGPYASTGSVVTVVEKHRQVGLRTMDLNILQRIGVTEALAPRTMQTLVLLDFYDDKGQIGPAFDDLRKVTEEEFKPRLAELLKQAYADVLTVLDPATASLGDVENAFRGFEPTGQIGRMVQLFVGLFTYVGVMPEGKVRRGRTASATGGSKSRGRAAATTTSNSNSAAVSAGPKTEPPKIEDRLSSPAVYSHTVTLATGATMTLSVTVNPFTLRGSDREFFFKVLDSLVDYGAADDPSRQTAAGATQTLQEAR